MFFFGIVNNHRDYKRPLESKGFHKGLFRSSIVDIALRWYSWNDGLVHFVAISTEAPIPGPKKWDDCIFADP